MLIEELYDSTAPALLSRPYESEEHLRVALHKGIKMRALRLHRDRTAHRQTLAHAARRAISLGWDCGSGKRRPRESR